MSFNVGDKVQHKKSKLIGVIDVVGTAPFMANTLIVIVQLPSHDSTEVWYKNEVDLFMSSSSQQPSPYSGGLPSGSSQATQLPLDLFDDGPAVCSCGPRFLDDPHKKDCKVKTNETK